MTSQTPDPGPERRVAVRFRSTQTTSCHFATLEKISSRWAVVANVSASGIGLNLPCPLDPGSEVLIEFPSKDLGQPRVVAAFVIHSRPTDNAWAIGCTFARPLSQEELDLLL